MKDEKGRILLKKGIYLGRKTNNEAEYEAVLGALDWVEKNLSKVEAICFYFDYKLLVNQLTGRWRVKAVNLQPLLVKAREKIVALSRPVSFSYLPRQKNAAADRLVNLTLDRIAV